MDRILSCLAQKGSAETTSSQKGGVETASSPKGSAETTSSPDTQLAECRNDAPLLNPMESTLNSFFGSSVSKMLLRDNPSERSGAEERARAADSGDHQGPQAITFSVHQHMPSGAALARAGGATDLGITPRLPFRSEWRESSAHLHLDLDGSESQSLRQTRSVAQRFQERERKGAGGTGGAGNLVDMSCRSPTTSPQ